jgi:hypothetical protein
MRKLAHVETIDWIKPIEGADNIELCGILGWQCVIAKKENFKVGYKVVYVEVDSVMPEKPEYEFLKSRNYRVRTIKLKGQVSQGLVLPITVLNHTISSIANGTDVTDKLGVTKYLTPSEREEEKKVIRNKSKLQKFMMRYSWWRRLFLSRSKKESFPFWVAKTDEERIQNIPQVLDQFKDKDVYVTEKIDYQSGTWTGKMIDNPIPIIGKFLPKKYQFVVCSRNLTNTDKNSLYWKIAEKYNLEQILRENPTLTIQGEQGDTKVQGNKYGLKEPKMWVFNIIDHEKGYFYNLQEIVTFCRKYNLEHVPIITLTTNGEMNFAVDKLSYLGNSVQDIVEFSKGKSTVADIPREGIVVRCIENGQKLLSFKAINPDFLLKYSD